MFDLVLHQPQIPPNTGNIIRLCANSGANLHLIEPLGFCLDEKSCRRAVLDYKEMAKVKSWPDFNSYKTSRQEGRLWLITKFGHSCYSEQRFDPDDSFVFENEIVEKQEEIEAVSDETFKNLSLSDLKDLLKKAVQDEDYEVAAKIRDEISKR